MCRTRREETDGLTSAHTSPLSTTDMAVPGTCHLSIVRDASSAKSWVKKGLPAAPPTGSAAPPNRPAIDRASIPQRGPRAAGRRAVVATSFRSRFDWFIRWDVLGRADVQCRASNALSGERSRGAIICRSRKCGPSRNPSSLGTKTHNVQKSLDSPRRWSRCCR